MRRYKVNIILQQEFKEGGGESSVITNAVVTANSMFSAASKVFASRLKDYRENKGDRVRVEFQVGQVVAKKN